MIYNERLVTKGLTRSPMIHVERHQQVPKSLQDATPDSSRSLLHKPDVRAALIANFGEKCAYCEQPLELLNIDHFVPISIDPSRQLDWHNLFPACNDCNLRKGKRFPTLQGKPLLLNPCKDEPQALFLYNGMGHIVPLNGDLRATVTIEILDLNRVDLVSQRKKIYDSIGTGFRACLELYRNEGGLSRTDELKERGKQAYEKAAERFFKDLKEHADHPKRPFSGVYHFLYRHFFDFFFSLAHEEWERELIKRSHRFRDGASYRKMPDWLPVSPRLRLEKICLKSIRCFEEVEIDLGEDAILFLGINGRGKSTLMQLPALLLRHLAAPGSGVPWTRLTKFDSTQQAGCSLTLKYNDQNLELSAVVDEDDRLVFEKTFEPKSISNNLMVLAYGAGRHVKLEDVQPANGFESIASLFGDNGYLKNIQQATVNALVQGRKAWFMDILNPILSGGDNQVALSDFTTETALFKTASDPIGRTPLEAMSDGFRATYAWLFDFLVRVAIQGDRTKDIRGIVMVDEIDLHLHPAWQRTIIPSLRKTFPQVQFIFSCHSPYSVQSMDTNKVFLLKQEGQEVRVEPLLLDGLPDGQNIEEIIARTIALETQLPNVGEALFNKLKELKRAAIDGNKMAVVQHYREIIEKLPENSNYREFVEITYRSVVGEDV